MEGGNAISRELTRSERKAIRKLVTGMCANYDREYGCLPLNCPCYMLNKWRMGAYCRYFRDFVLPLNPMLAANLTEDAVSLVGKTCPICGTVYVPVTSQAYCSEVCAKKGRRAAYRRYNENRK